MFDAAHPSRSARLRHATRAAHERVDALVGDTGLFRHRAGYLRFLRVQHRFHAVVRPLYDPSPLLRAWPALAGGGRLEAVAADLRDLGAAPDAVAAVPAILPGDPAAIGWLYCAEGSLLGAAILLKRAAALAIDEHRGARHLAAPEGGRGRRWAAVVAGLDALDLPPEHEQRCIAGALAAFALFETGLSPARNVA
ncbi:biliverdin-producing heme oxygenase [Rhizosaccharibacter radicis]|uniref:Biliverdin-producing heme oxygenase n=1 Tax=Rhizosaccharibacter radicis TaxID=2782605 RepID=A0ABT1VUX0_9PROT|nr:biliverdin-producing heme oxygenase [Acetobacteraceae bacterium KSS12]